MTYIEVTDRHGQHRRARPGEVAQDGETFYFPQQFMDAAAVLAEKYGKPAVTDYRPQGRIRGYAFSDVSQDARDDAAKAYAERSARMQDAWRKRTQDNAEHTPPSAQDARATADAAYADKKQRLAGGWKTR
jgi:hypothetical protein